MNKMFCIKILQFNSFLTKRFKLFVNVDNLINRHLCTACSPINSGLNIWSEKLETSTKLRIEQYWRDKLIHKEFQLKHGSKKKFYVLSMFPYPSGNLHMGHVRVYTISDTMARFYKMNGWNVLHPMGWDAFGLPAENAALERGILADVWTNSNIKAMKEQLIQLGCDFDWNREISTCQPEYYKHTQEIFLRMYDEGLVYRQEALVNWDPIDQTVLADEQVDESGCSWRSGAKVEKKVLKQWFIRTTKFAKSLYNGLDDPNLKDWRDIVKMQKHWIGECNGASFDFPLIGLETSKHINIWTPKPEHIDKAKFVAAVQGSVLDLRCSGEGARKLNVEVLNPLSGESLPVYVTDKVEYDLERDYHLGIPNMYESDYDFAKSVNIPVVENVELKDDLSKRTNVIEQLNGIECSSKLRDWLISRQRYWGTPIPMVHCSKCGDQPVPYDKLPVTLPPVDKHTQTAEQISTSCPKCGGHAEKDTDTMDTFVDSSWYFLRYTDPHNTAEPFDKQVAAKMMPVDVYIGGKEHAVLHLYYARFVTHFLNHIGWIPYTEPFTRLIVQGMVMGKTYKVKGTGKYLKYSDVDFSGKKPVEAGTGKRLVETWEKMSKSKQNGVEPSEILKEYSVDTTRLLILADVAPTSNRNWNTNTFPGIINWQRRLWITVQDFRNARSGGLDPPPDLQEKELSLWDSRNFYIRGVTFNYAVTHYLSVAISKLQGLTNDLRRHSAPTIAHSLEYERALSALVIMLAPITPHFASELWTGIATAQGLKNKYQDEVNWSKSVLEQSWPKVDGNYKVNFVCLVNSAVKCTIKLPHEQLLKVDHEMAIKIALEQEEVQSFISQLPILDSEFNNYFGIEGNINLKIDHTKLNIKEESQN